MMKQFSKKILCPILLLVALLTAGAIALPVAEGAEAKTQENLFSIEQKKTVTYCGSAYIDNSGNFVDFDEDEEVFDNVFFDSFSFFYDGLPVDDLKPTDIKESNKTSVEKPGEYNLNFSVNYKDTAYTVKDVKAYVNKITVTVSTYLNGTTDLTIQEGETVLASYGYSGALEEHSESKYVNGFPITQIKRNYITSYAFVREIPKQPTERRQITAAYATSDYYDFVYESAYITIQSVTTNKLIYGDKKSPDVTLMGTFSSICSLSYLNIGIDKSSTEFALVYAKAEAKYKDVNFFDEYREVACYSVDILSDGVSLTEKTAANVLLKTNLSSDKTYKVMAFYKNGDSEILDASYTSGTLRFYSADMGDFIVVTPNEGLSITNYLLVIGVGVLTLI